MTRESIIRTALRVWGREFYQSTSLSKLARALGVSKPALYRHFGSKGELLEAMRGYFFDGYAEFLRPFFERALETELSRERVLIMIRGIAEYYSRDMDTFLFALIRIYGNRTSDGMRDFMRDRGMDLRRLLPEGSRGQAPVFQLALASLTFRLGIFHRFYHGLDEPPGDEAVREITAAVERQVLRGLDLDRETVLGLDYPGLENSLVGDFQAYHRDDGLLKAVAEAVAEAGPWNASMDMVARRSGLSKSGLYAHFASKEDMLRQLFLTEFDRIAHYAELSAGGLPRVEERLYLVILSVAAYLRSNPEILVAMDWFRTRRVNFDVRQKLRIFQIVAAMVSPPGAESGEGPGEQFRMTGEQTAQWMLFLIISTLIPPPGGGVDISALSTGSIRGLYRFIALGLEGFDL